MYENEYKRKLTKPAIAADFLKNGDTIIHGMAAGEPPALLEALADKIERDDLRDIKVLSLLPMKHAKNTLLKPELSTQVYAYTYFVSSADRDLTGVGIDQFIPNHFHEVPRLINDYMSCDIVVTTVSPPDRHGFFTF